MYLFYLFFHIHIFGRGGGGYKWNLYSHLVETLKEFMYGFSFTLKRRGVGKGSGTTFVSTSLAFNLDTNIITSFWSIIIFSFS